MVQEVYGLEKLYHEEMCLAYSRDFPLITRIARSAPTSNTCAPPSCHLLTWSCCVVFQVPQRVRPVRHVEGRPREGPRCLLPQGRHNQRYQTLNLTRGLTF